MYLTKSLLSPTSSSSFLHSLATGVTRRRSNVYYPQLWVVLWSGIASFLGMAAIMLISQYALSGVDLTLTVGSFGATAVLLYAAPHSPLAQPRNLLVGHMISAVVGVTCNLMVGTPDELIGEHCVNGGERPALQWLAGSLAVSVSIVAMHLLKSLHPPGGATALIAVIGTKRLKELGYLYVVCPIALGAVVMLAVALLVDNLARGISYPKYWW
jgi:CBS-domain-containing membrane protein